MKYGAAVIVAIALALPAFGQHGGAHGGFAGHGGSGGHSGFVGHSGFSGSHGFSGHVSAPRFGARSWQSSRPGFTRPTMPIRSGFGAHYRGINQHRPPYGPGLNNRNRGWDWNRRRRGWYGGAYGYGYPGWGYVYPYPFWIEPGFYDWGDTGDSGYDQNSSGNYPPYTDYGTPNPDSPQEPDYAQPPYPQPYPQQPYAQAPYQPYSATPAPTTARPPYSGSAAAGPSEEPVTLIFKDGRTPQIVRNYMMDSKVLTAMDAQRFQRIPLDEIDIAATEKVNRAHGVDFQVPTALRD